MQMGMVGLGRMGANMVRRLINGGHECVVFDVSADAVKELAKERAPSARRRSTISPPSSSCRASRG